MPKILVKLRDTSGGFAIVTQQISVNRRQVKRVEHDSFVQHAIIKGALVKATEAEFKDSQNMDKDAFLKGQKKLAAEAKKKESVIKEAVDKSMLANKDNKSSKDKTNNTDKDDSVKQGSGAGNSPK